MTAKTHSPITTYNQGDRCKIRHTINGRTQDYIFESLETQVGTFYVGLWKNITPRVWRLPTFNMDGYVYPSDTVFVGSAGYKNETLGVNFIRQLVPLEKDLFAFPTISAFDSVDVYYGEVSNSYANNFGRNTNPNWNKTLSRSRTVYFSYVENQVIMKITTIDAPVNFLPNYTPTPHYLALQRGSHSSWNLLSTPDTGISSDQEIRYNLSSTPGDFQYFIITNNNNILSVRKLNINDNI